MLVRSHNPIVWAAQSGTVVLGNSVCKIAGGDAWNGGAYSRGGIRGGFMEFRPLIVKNMIAGLSATPDGIFFFDSVDFGIHLNGSGQVGTVESGTFPGTLGTYVVGDLFRVEAIGAVVRYYKNNALIRTSGLSPTYPLYLDMSLFEVSSALRDLRLVEV